MGTRKAETERVRFAGWGLGLLDREGLYGDRVGMAAGGQEGEEAACDGDSMLGVGEGANDGDVA